MNLIRCFRRRRYSRFGIIGRDLALCGGNESNRALSIIPPAVRIGIFFSGVMQPRNLIFQSRSVALVDNRRCHKDEQVALGSSVGVTLKYVSEQGHVSQQWNFRAALRIAGVSHQIEVTAARKFHCWETCPCSDTYFKVTPTLEPKRNLLVFVTPTIIDQRYGTGLEDQVSGLHHTGEEYADPNGWRNNAKGAVRLVPTAQRQVAGRLSQTGNTAGAGNSE